MRIQRSNSSRENREKGGRELVNRLREKEEAHT